MATTWIFQGNPDQFDVDQYLRTTAYAYWLVRLVAYQNRVEIGDRVYLWRARGKSQLTPGVIASGVVRELPAPEDTLLRPDLLYEVLWKIRPPTPTEKRAGIELDTVRLSPEDGMLPLSVISSDPTLSKMTIVTRRTGTNFPLNPEEATRLASLWKSGEWLEEQPGAGHYSTLEGARRLMWHYRRERDPALVAKAKEAFRAKHGSVFCELCGFSFTDEYGGMAVDFIEAHHKVPLASLSAEARTTPDSLMMLCANCHRVVHLADDPTERLAALRELRQTSKHPAVSYEAPFVKSREKSD